MNIGKSVKRILYKNSSLQIEFFSFLPKTLLSYDTHYLINYNPVVYIKYINNSLMKDKKTTVGENAYKMSPKNQGRIVKFFKTVLDWFSDPDLKDLFLINDNNELIFNADYNHLHAIISKTKYDAGLLKAMPNIVMFEDERCEGVYLYINQFTNSVNMTKEEIESIYFILSNFSFTSEISSMINILDYVEKNNLIITDMNEWTRITSPLNTYTYSNFSKSNTTSNPFSVNNNDNSIPVYNKTTKSPFDK